jgi:hypothetical protein
MENLRLNLFHLIQALSAAEAIIGEEWRTILRAPIAALLIAAIVFCLTWILVWSLFRHKLTTARNLIETLESSARARDEERSRRNADPVEWFRFEATKEIYRIRRNPIHPYNKGEKIGVTLMNRMQLIAHIHEYGIEKDRSRDANV